MNKCKSKFNGGITEYFIVKRNPKFGTSDIYVVNVNKINFHTDLTSLMMEEGDIRFLTTNDFDNEFIDLKILIERRQDKIKKLLND
jgi:hypothetical protein